jgi:urease gamma subunit
MVFVRSLYPHAKDKLKAPYLKINIRQEVKPMKLSAKHADELIELLLKIPDPRMARGIRHQKLSVLAIAICAIMSNARSFSAIAEWAKRCSQNMLKRLQCRYNEKTEQYEPPSEPTIRRFLQQVDPDPVDQALCGWLQSISGKDFAVAVDGKTLKGARQNNGRQIHLLSAFLHNQGTVLAQCQVDSKTNEITMVTPLLDPLDLKGQVVTLDALHTQKETARYLVEEKQSDYLFIVKDNQRTLKKDIDDLHLVDFPPSTPNH